MAAKVKTVQKAQKDQGSCSKCGTALPAGSAYRYFKPGFRSRIKVRRCMKSECTPKRSELETSKLAEVYAAQEVAYDSIAAAESFQDLSDAITDLESAAQEVLDDYESQVDEHPFMEETVRDRIDALQSFVDDLSGFSPDEEDEPEEDEDDFEEKHERWKDALDEARQAANDLISGFEY
jgi:hypothetical protein